MSDIVERLEHHYEHPVHGELPTNPDGKEAADTITALRAEVAKEQDCGQHYREEIGKLRAKNEKLRAALGRARTVLGNMALENEGAIFNRWPINHEPLRADARNLLPVIDAALKPTAASPADPPRS